MTSGGVGWGLAIPPDFRDVIAALHKLDDRSFEQQLKTDLRQLLASKVVPTAQARARAQGVPHEIPGSIRAGVDRKGPFVRAGGARAPAAAVFEGTRDGADRRHPVYGTGERPGWTWVTQKRRPFLRPAAEEHADDVREQAGQSVLKVMSAAGLRDSS